MPILETVKSIVGDILQLGEIRTQGLTADSALLGALPEFDSMAVVSVLTALEEQFGFVVLDDEINAETFTTMGSLTHFVEQKLGA